MAFKLPRHGFKEGGGIPPKHTGEGCEWCWAWDKGIFRARRNSLGASGWSGLHAEREPIDTRTIRVAFLL